MKFRQVIVLVSTLISIFGIYWINAGNTSLKRTGEVAGREEVINYALPPGFSFSIWGLIYLGFLIYALYGLKKTIVNQDILDRTAYPIAVSIALNFIWIIIVGLELWLPAYFLQWLMLIISLAILIRWRSNKEASLANKWLSIPFALYAGWLTVAMIPFTSDLLNKSGWDYAPFAPRTWAIIVYITACVIVLFAYKKLGNPFYIFPLAWVFFGYFIRFDEELKVVAGILMVITFVFFIFQLSLFFKGRRTAS